MRTRIELRPLTFLVVGAAILGAQRFLLPGVDVLACLIPYVAALFCFRARPVERNTLLLMALFLSVDNGGEGYPETISLIRYPIYLTALYALVREGTFSLRRVSWFLAFFSFWVLAALFQADVVGTKDFIHDAVFAGVLGVLWLRSEDTLESFCLDLRLLNKFFLVFIGCELVNFALFYTPQGGHYLSYNSTKSMVLFPAFYLVARGRKVLAALALSLTMIVLVGYGTRMIPVMLILALLVFVGARIFRGPFALVKLSLVAAALVSVLKLSHWVLADGTNDSYKILHFVHRLFFEVDSIEALRVVDPVRYDEHVMFFARSWIRVLFGDGFGAGLKDVENLMGQVKIDQTAFTADEINSGFFFGLHDMWTDVGLRFGLGIILLSLAWVVRQFRKDKFPELALWALLLFVVMNCAFFATAGIIATSFVVLALRNAIYLSQRSVVRPGITE